MEVHNIVAVLTVLVLATAVGINSQIVSKKRFCPYLPAPSYCRDSYDFCKTDGDCHLANYKCCSNGCKKICAVATQNRTEPPSEVTQLLRPGNCPVLPISKFCFSHESNECSNDFDCKEYYKCCSNGCTRRCVVSTTTKAVESGQPSFKNATCPKFPANSSSCPQDSTNQCTADNDCSVQGSSYKCCWDGCRKICLDPSELQQTQGRGLCPAIRPQSTCTSFQHECIDDSECRRGDKCCSDGCTMKCVKTKESPTPTDTTELIVITANPNQFRLDDKCPYVPRPLVCPVSSIHQCYSNDECPNPLMCCSDGCRNICHDVTKDTSLLLCPIPRRPDRCPSDVKSSCVSISDCESGTKCCFDGCNFKCFGRSGFQPQGPSAIEPLLSLADVVFTLDTSDGPRGSEFELQKSFALSLSRMFDLGPNKVHLALVSSGQTATISKHFYPYVTQSDFESFLKRIHQQGRGRSLDDAMDVIKTKVFTSGRDNVPRIVIVFSFGLPSSSVWDLLTAAHGLHTKGIKVFAVGVDVQEDEPQLRALVSRPQDLFTFRDARELENVGSIFASHVVCRAENVVPENFDVDIIFFIDSSNSIGRSGLQRIQKFIISMARVLNVGPKKSRASLINFGDVVADIVANFGSVSTINELTLILDKMVFLGGDSRIDRALEKTDKVLDKARSDVRTVAVLVTDSYHLVDGINPLHEQIAPLVRRGLEMYALVIGGGQDGVRRLAGLTSRQSDIFTASNYDVLPGLITPVARYIVNGPPPTTSSPTTTRGPTASPELTTQQQTDTEAVTDGATTEGATATATATTKAETTPVASTAAPTTEAATTAVETEAATTETPTTEAATTESKTAAPTTQATTVTPTKAQTTTEYVAAGNNPTTGVSSSKQGRCPTSLPLAHCRLSTQCVEDLECGGFEKCCSGCCVRPNSNVENAPAKGLPKPGICPIISRAGIACPSSDQCGHDQDCASTKKCCRHYCSRMVCVEPPSKEEEKRLMNSLYRPGKCRTLQSPDVCRRLSRPECNYDVDCANPTQKCCSDGCNRRCTDPLNSGPVVPRVTAAPIAPGKILGRCPPYSPARSCPGLVQDSCTCTSDCGSGFKCCFDGCKRICRKPAGEVCSAQVDIVYLMDTSGSISLSDYRLEKQFVKDLARIFRVDVDASRAAVIIYNDDPHSQINLGDHTSPDEFAKAIDRIPYLHGRTRIDKALKASLETFRTARPNVRKVLVLLTDGRQTQDPDAIGLDVASQPLKDMGVKIYAVGVGHQIDKNELKQIASKPSDVFTVGSFTALIGESQTIAAKACGDVISKICVRGVDLGFIVDSSESITDDDFNKAKKAIKSISDEFIISPQSTRAGIVVYSGKPHLSIHFDQYNTNADFNQAVNSLPHMQSHTRLDMALRYAASDLYNKRRVANPSIAIVLTDGKQTPGAESLTTAVKPLRDLGVRVFAVGVGPRISQSELRQIVERYEDVFTVDSFSQLIQEAKKITERACPVPSDKTEAPPVTYPTAAPKTTTTTTTLPPTTTLLPPLVTTAAPSTTPSNPCTFFLDIIFVLDSSRSMAVRQYNIQKDFVKRLAKYFNVGQGSRAAAIIYSDDPELSIDFDTYNNLDDFQKGIDRLPYIMQRTRIDKALTMASQVLQDSRPGFPRAVIIMTDGRQTRDPDYTPLDRAAAPLHQAGARVLVVGIGPAISIPELELMVKDKSDVFPVTSFDSLVNAASDVALTSCQGTVPTVLPDSCTESFDLVFVMDSSGSMLVSNFNKEKRFVKNVASRFDVGPTKVSLGLLSFSDWPTVHVAFGSQSSISLQRFNAALDGAQYTQGRSRIDRALQAASDLVKLGKRKVPKVLVFMTDGRQSEDPGHTPIYQAVKPLIDQDVKIIVVGIGRDIDRRQLYTLAGGQGRDVTQVGSFDDLDKLKNFFAQTICRKVEEIIQRGSP